MVLLLDCVADVDEFAVFEDQEVVLCCERLEAGKCGGGEIFEDVDVCFEDGDVGAQACVIVASVERSSMGIFKESYGLRGRGARPMWLRPRRR